MSSHGGQKRHTPGAANLEPLSRRLLQAAGVLSLLLVLVVVNSLLHGGDKSPFNPNPVAAAAEQVRSSPGARFTTYLEFSSPSLPGTVSASGSGAINGETGRLRVELAMNSSFTGPLHMVMISDGEYDYTSGTVVENKLPPGKEWVRSQAGSSGDGNATIDIDDPLRMLSAAGAVEMVGREPVDGRTTRHFRAEIQVSDFIDFLREEGKPGVAESYERIEEQAPGGITAEAWVDEADLLRRFRVVMPMPGKTDGPTVTVSLRMDLFDYGSRPDIRLPDPASVVDGSLDSDEAPTSATFS
ncbi:MAG TPA: hypothetical protein VFP21_04280 [Solirubrobacterales bacterium]|nr:hypothetical protein [Solirubrobacterales bacterium]